MDLTAIIVALVGCLGTVVTALFGIKQSNDKTLYRIDELEKKVEKHNNLVERTYHIEQEIAVLENKEKVTEHRLEDIEKGANT